MTAALMASLLISVHIHRQTRPMSRLFVSCLNRRQFTAQEFDLRLEEEGELIAIVCNTLMGVMRGYSYGNMNCTWNHTNNNRSHSEGESSNPVVLQVAFTFIASMAFLGNGLLCVVILRNAATRKSSYNMLIFNLAVTDMLTGIFMVVTPSFIITLESYHVHGVWGEIFCRLIGSQFFVYVLGKVSVFEVTCLAVERWYSVVKPLIHKDKFTRRRVHYYVAMMWLFSGFCHASMPFEMTLDASNARCTWIWASYHRSALITSFSLVSFFIPTAVTWVTYLHIMIALRASPSHKQKLARFTLIKYRLLRMCVFVALLLTFSWLPNQVYYTLSAFEMTTLETPFHHFTIVLAMFNSCVNPWVYCLSNKEYKRRFLRLLYPFTRCIQWRRRRTYDLQAQTPTGSNALPKRSLEAGILLNFRYLSVN